jgi:hypothetical protein
MLAAGLILICGGCVRPVQTDPPAIFCPGYVPACLQVRLSTVVLPFVQQYERQIEVVAEGRVVATWPLLPHHQHWLQMNLYSLSDGRLVLREGQWGLSTWLVDLRQRTVELQADPLQANASLTYLGAFDIDSARRFRFVGLKERGERPLPDFE